MTKKQILAMLRDQTQQIDGDAIVEFIEALDTSATQAESALAEAMAELDGVYDRLGIEDDERSLVFGNLDVLLAAKDKNVELEEQVADRWGKLTDEIAGKYEQLGKSQQALTGFRRRAEKMTFEELDAELEEVNESLREKLGPVERVTEPSFGDEGSTADKLSLKQIEGFRV